MATDSKRRRPSESLDAARLRHRVETSPAASILSDVSLELPSVEPPKLDDIQLVVPRRTPIDQEELVRRLYRLAREHAEEHQRAKGEPIEEADEVLVDLVGYAEGKLIPFSLKAGLWVIAGADPALPGLFEQLVGQGIPGHVRAQVVLPEDYPVNALKGKPARFLVDLLAARTLAMPDVESDAFLEKLDRGRTLDEVMDSLKREAEEERQRSWVIQAQNEVLDELIRRAPVRVPRALVDAEIRLRWAKAEGKIALAKGFSADEQRESMDGWLADPGTRADVERRLQIALVLKAIASKEGLVPTAQTRWEMFAPLAEALGLPSSARNWGSKEENLRALAGPLDQLYVLSHVMARVEVVQG